MSYERGAPVESIAADTSIPPRRTYQAGDSVTVLGENGEAVGPFKIALRLDKHHYWIDVPDIPATDSVYAETALRPFVSDFANIPLGTPYDGNQWPLTRITSAVYNANTGQYEYEAQISGFGSASHQITRAHAENFPQLIEDYRRREPTKRSLIDRIALPDNETNNTKLSTFTTYDGWADY
ncbi:hypothetical protein DFP72DRAFT_843419 [Ephemerocybe angulata]|uniref:Uncharacterized protein n=1 Tax=Ephemerocybe angulata TaxID=980116 RepID=A0A8H6MCX2_9AGAR|nr:hypothetical protein DFP72DRAFT_843419 [Tulosesus angulatus]